MSQADLPAGWPAMSMAEALQRLTAPGTPFELQTVEVGGRPIRAWKNAPPSLRAVVEAGRAFGDRIAFVYEDERVSYEAFHRAVAAFARELAAQGVGKGDRVAVIMRNLPEWPVAFYATVSLGAIATPLNAWWTGEELEYGLTDSGVKVAVMDAERFERLTDHLPRCPALKRIYVSRASDDIAHPAVVKLESVIGPATGWASLPDTPAPAADIDPDDTCGIFYTSGTTGRPKGGYGSHRAFNGNVMLAAYAHARSFLRRGEAPPAADPAAPQRAILISVPFFHVTGAIAIMNPGLASGAKIVMLHKWDPVRAFQLIEREKINSAGGVPTIAWQILEHPARADYDLSSLDAVSYGGAPSAPELVRKLDETLPGSTTGTGWGMTETFGTVINHGSQDYLNRPSSCGVAGPVFDAQIRDPADGVSVYPVGEVGELWVRGPVATGYWNKPEATAQTFVDGWVRTGDLARLDEEGFCFIIDRAKDMLIRGGENIYCIEVENRLYDHPAVMDAAVVGRPHRTLGEEPVAVVKLKPDTVATEAELRAHVAQHLAAFKVPVEIRFSPDILPRNANGKILKRELRAWFEDETPSA